VREKRERGELSELDDSGNEDSDESSAASDDQSADDKSDIDSEEEEIRKIKRLNRDRKKRGKITRRRRRRKKRDADGDANASESESGDEVPLAILKKRKEKAERLRILQQRKDKAKRERQLEDMNLMVNKQDDQLLKKKKQRKKRSRTNPKNTCALGSLPVGRTSEDIDASTASMAEASAAKLNVFKSGQQTNKSKDQSQNDSVEMEVEESNANSQQQGGKKSAFDFDSDSDSVSSSKRTSKKQMKENEDRQDESVAFDDVDDFANDNEDSSDDDDDLALSGLGRPASPSVLVDNGDSTNGRTDADNDETEEDEELLTPREEGYMMDSSDDEELLTPREEGMMDSSDNEDNDSVDFDGSFNDNGGANVEGTSSQGMKLKDMKWRDLPKLIRDLCAQVEDERIRRVQDKVSKLKRRLELVRKKGRAPTRLALLPTTRDMMDELEHLSKESGELNEYIIKELHRNGVDQCNKALMRLLSRRERRENENTLTEVEKKTCRDTAVELLDHNVDQLSEHVKDIDAKVTSFRKEVEKELQTATTEDWSIGSAMGDTGDAFPAEDTEIDQEGPGMQQRQKKRRTKEKDWDEHHPHASRKRKSSSATGQQQSRQKSSLKHKRRQQHCNSERGTAASNNSNRHNTNAGRRKQSSQTGSTSEMEDHIPSPGSDIEVDTAMNFEPEVEFVGETDDLDDHQGSVLPDTSGAGRAPSRRATQQQRSNNNASSSQASSRAGGGSGSSRQSRPMSGLMEGWLDRQQGSDTEVIESTTAANGSRGRNSVGRQSGSGNSGQRNDRAASARASNNGMLCNGGRTVCQQEHGLRCANTSRTPRPRASNPQSNNNTRRQDGSMARSKNNAPAARRRRVEIASSTNRPTIPRALSAEILFDSLSSLQEDNAAADEEHTMMHYDDDRSLGELSQELKDCYPSRLPLCRNVLVALTALVLSRSNADELPKDEIVTLFQILHSVFQRKCTTLLDILQTNPEVASFQMDCWCLVFRMVERKWNGKLRQEDGILYQIFGNHATLANHILLQVIDALYSQLLWEEYGKTPTFNNQVFDQLRCLCVRIGAVVPLLSTVCDLLAQKFGRLMWHKSVTIEQKENELEKVLFVSAIDPEMHKQFISLGDIMDPPVQGESRLRSFKEKIPREESEAIWSIIGFSSRCTTLTRSSAPDLKQPQNLLGRLLSNDCGTLSEADQQLPPPKLQVDTCSKEIKWICALLSSKLLGNLPSMDSFVKSIFKRSVALDAFDAILGLLPITPKVKVNKTVKQLWGYSCIVGSSAELESDLQTGLVNLDSNDSTHNVYCSMPSSVLLRRCVSLVATYAKMMMTKKTRWKKFRTSILDPLADGCVKQALEVEAKSESIKALGREKKDAFAEMFQSIETATEIQIVESPTSSHFREAACYLMLASVVARSHYNVPGEGNNFHLNKDFRESIWKYSSDEKMHHHQKHFLDKMSGDIPASSSNICLLYTSAKTMTFTTLLHLHVNDFKSEPLQTAELLRNHLLAVKIDDDVNMMEYLLTSIISTLLASCDVLDNLNQRGRVSAEREDECKAFLNSSKSIIDIISLISMRLSLIFGRAKFIMELITKVNPSSDDKLAKLAGAIKRLGGSSFFLFVMQSLTKALRVIVQTATSNTFSKALNNEGCLENSFRGCLGAIRNSIALVHSCGMDDTHNMQHAQSNMEWETAAKTYLSFVTTQIIPSCFDKNENGEYRKLCLSQSGGVTSVLAALCSISEAGQALIGVYDIFKPHPAQNASEVYLQQIGACFSSELARLAQYNRSCKALATKNVVKLLNYLLVSLVDSDSLALFPTSNLSLLSHLDGHNSRSKGNDQLSKVQIHSPLACQDPDEEAFKIKRMRGDYFDSAGPTYTSKNIWSFCENVGRVLQTWPLMKSIGKDLVNSCEKLRSDKDLLGFLSQVSVERECLKRLLLFQNLFKALKRDNHQCLDAVLGKDGGVYRVISTSIIQNLYYLSGSELEHEEQQRIGCIDSGSRYKRAKALAFHRAYVELSGSLIALMLRESNNWEGTNTCELVRRNLVAPAFRGNLDFRSVVEGAATKLNLCLRKRSSKGNLNHMTKDLLMTFIRHTGELLAYGAGCADNYGAILLNAMLRLPSTGTALIDSFIKAASCRLILTSEAVGVYSTVSSEGLQRTIDDRLLCSEVLRSDGLDEQKSILGLRELAMGKSFVHLLNSHDTTPPSRVMSLKLLTCMIKTYSSKDIISRQKIHDASGNLSSTASYTKLFHALKGCLRNSVTSSSVNATFITEFFSCVRQFLALPILLGTAVNESTQRDSLTLLSWARASPKNNTVYDSNSSHSAYIYEVSMWLDVCGKLLENQASITTLHGFLIRTSNKEGGQYSLDDAESNSLEMQQLCKSFNSLSNLERVLSLEKTNSGRSSNPYSGDSSIDAVGGHDDPLSSEARRAIEEFSNYLVDSNV